MYTSQTAAIKAVVQANSMGFLAGTTGANMIYVKYYLPVSPFTEVTGTAGANKDGNVIEVSISGYTQQLDRTDTVVLWSDDIYVRERCPEYFRHFGGPPGKLANRRDKANVLGEQS